MISYAIKETGNRYGRLVVLGKVTSYVSPQGKKQKRVRVVCDCGSVKTVNFGQMKLGNIKSCGCLRKEIAANTLSKCTTHGMSRTRFYKVWASLKNRTLNPTDSAYHRYGGRGIKVCDRWKESFQNFKNDMFASYGNGLEIDRINNDGDYTPENCRWVTRKVNMHNSTRVRVYNGKCITDWAKTLGVARMSIHWRMKKKKESLEEAIEHFRKN